MAYDEELAERIRAQLDDEHDVTEKKMFGGMGFMLRGNMAVGIASTSELMVRVGPDGNDEALAKPHTRPFDMSGKRMNGWILVSAEGVADDAELAAWVQRGIDHAASLKPKG
jgi:TfoX/Sxy family transcriptional regulator of competence genes